MGNLLERQIVALRKSVLKWEKIVATLEDPTRLTVTDKGDEDCACCKEFLDNSSDGCGGCPVQENTGLSHCWESPYELWGRTLRETKRYKDSPYTRIIDPTQRKTLTRLAKNELKFLQGLLKTKENDVRKTVIRLQKLI